MGYRVIRQDDNGFITVMARFDVRAEADSIAATFEARAHKQMYWVEVDAPSTDRGDDRGRVATSEHIIPSG